MGALLWVNAPLVWLLLVLLVGGGVLTRRGSWWGL